MVYFCLCRWVMRKVSTGCNCINLYWVERELLLLTKKSIFHHNKGLLSVWKSQAEWKWSNFKFKDLIGLDRQLKQWESKFCRENWVLIFYLILTRIMVWRNANNQLPNLLYKGHWKRWDLKILPNTNPMQDLILW